MQIDKKIKAIREDHDLNQTQVAKILKTEQSYYSKDFTENRYRDKKEA